MNELSLFEPELSEIVKKITQRVVSELATEYGFSEQEALQKLGAIKSTQPRDIKEEKNKINASKETKKKTARNVPQIPLPFCGIINDNWCQGVRSNYNLYTQCTNNKHKNGQLCATCEKQSQKNNGKPIYGFIQDRKLEHTKAVRYATVMKKKKITRDQAEKEAARFGMHISEIEYEEKVVKRGRPKRPPRKIVYMDEDDTEPVVKQENNQCPEPPKFHSEEESESESESESETETEVEEFEHGNKKYLKDAEGKLYDIDTHNLIGVYNQDAEEIEFVKLV